MRIVFLFFFSSAVFAMPSPRRCEYLLNVGPSGLITKALDSRSGDRAPRIAENATEEALAVFGLESLNADERTRLRMFSAFNAGRAPELTLFLNLGERNWRHLKALENGNPEFYYWKLVGTYGDVRDSRYIELTAPPTQDDWGYFRQKPELGFRYPGPEHAEFSIFLSVRLLSSQNFQVTVGLDTACDRTWIYARTARFIEKILNRDGVMCRVPVLRFKSGQEIPE